MSRRLFYVHQQSKRRAENVCGKNVAFLRKNMGLSQRQLADALQLAGLDIDKNAVQRIECGKRFVTDIEIIAIAATLGVSLDALLRRENIL